LYDELKEKERKHPDQLKIHSISNDDDVGIVCGNLKCGRICKEDLMEACKDILPQKVNSDVDFMRRFLVLGASPARPMPCVDITFSKPIKTFNL